jgi:hypothetical protein
MFLFSFLSHTKGSVQIQDTLFMFCNSLLPFFFLILYSLFT